MPRKKERRPDPNQLHLESHLFAELVHAHLALMNLFSREVGITPARLKLVHEFLHAGQEGISLSDLAWRLGVTPALVTRQVKEVEKKGWVQRQSDPEDGRRRFIRLSAKGQNSILKLHERAHHFETVLLKGMDAKDVTAATRVLANLSAKFESWRRTGRRFLEAD